MIIYFVKITKFYKDIYIYIYMDYIQDIFIYRYFEVE